MGDVGELLELSKSVASRAGAKLLENRDLDRKKYVHAADNLREIKAVADSILEKEILRGLAPTGLPILSEEAGQIPGNEDSGHRFIVDPLDGTFNFVKGLGPSAISIALCEDERPVFGVIFNLSDRKLAWGGPQFGAFRDDEEITVSSTSSRTRGCICTGFPVRFDFADEPTVTKFSRLVSSYAKVRMLGSAAVSLLYVATGSAEAYAEDNIMLWDVAAGLALVEGAGGAYRMESTATDWCLRVYASNGRMDG